MRRVAGFYWNAGQLVEAEPLLRDLVEKRVKNPSADDVSWARWHLALVLASGTDYGRFREALESGRAEAGRQRPTAPRAERERGDSTDTRRFQARVLAAQAGHRHFRQRALELLEELERNKALRPDDRFILAMLYESEGAWVKAKPILQQLARRTRTGAASPGLLRASPHRTQGARGGGENGRPARRTGRSARPGPERLRGDRIAGASAGRARQGRRGLERLEKHLQRPKAKPEEVLLVLNSMRRQKKVRRGVGTLSADLGREEMSARGDRRRQRGRAAQHAGQRHAGDAASRSCSSRIISRRPSRPIPRAWS